MQYFRVDIPLERFLETEVVETGKVDSADLVEKGTHYRWLRLSPESYDLFDEETPDDQLFEASKRYQMWALFVGQMVVKKIGDWAVECRVKICLKGTSILDLDLQTHTSSYCIHTVVYMLESSTNRCVVLCCLNSCLKVTVGRFTFRFKWKWNIDSVRPLSHQKDSPGQKIIYLLVQYM